MAKKILAYLALFSSAGTLVCCALPALFVSLGFGAAFVSVLTTLPQLIWLSEHKTAVFIVSGLLLCTAAIVTWVSRSRACPIESELAEACAESRAVGPILLLAAATFYLIGGFFAYVAPLIF